MNAGSRGMSPTALLGLICLAALAAPLVVGLGYLTGRALDDGTGAASLARISRVVLEPGVLGAIVWSLGTAAAATVLATVAAIALALATRRPTRRTRAARMFALAPLPVPHLVAALLGLLILAQSGFLARGLLALGLIADLSAAPVLTQDTAGIGAILVLAWKEMPYLALLAMALLARHGVAAEEAARTLGASPWQCFRHVTWPRLRDGLLPALVTVFVFAAGCYEIAVLLGPSDPVPLPVLIAERQTDASLARRADADVLALLAFALGAVAVAAHEWARRRADRLD
jgi:ABC-type spermidine/putrescine transport system permease subunit I